MRLPVSAAAAAVLGVCLLASSGACAADAKRPAPRVAPVEHPARPIVVTVNGTALGSDESALVMSGRVIVPLRSVFSALHLAVESHGDSSAIRLPDATLTVTTGSANGHLGARVVPFDTPVQNIKGRRYVPLALFRQVFGAVVTYDARNAHVTIVSALQAQAATSGTPPVQGTVSNVDTFSSPPVISVVSDGQVRTLPLRSGVPVYIEDVNAGTRTKEPLSAVHVGDIASVRLGADGSVSEIDDSFRSRSGSIAALSSKALALESGYLVMPGRDTTISLNGNKVGLDALHVGDAVTIRSNPESLELREIIASREVATVATTAAVRITQVAFEPSRALRAHAELTVFLRGTPHASASFDIGTAVVGIPMQEMQAGVYRGIYLVAPGANFRNASVVGHLQLGSVAALPVTAATPFSAATLAPQVVTTAPRDGQAVNNTRPSIYAAFETPTGIAIDPASISISVGGRDVTNLATRTKQYVTYLPDGELSGGAVPVVVTVADVAGNSVTYRWSFREGL